MTAKQITELHDLCLQINLFAERHKQAPIAMYHMIGDENPFTTMICIEIYQTEPFNIIKTFTFSTDTISTEDVKGRYYRLYTGQEVFERFSQKECGGERE